MCINWKKDSETCCSVVHKGLAFCRFLEFEHRSVIHRHKDKLVATILWTLKKSQNIETRPETSSISHKS